MIRKYELCILIITYKPNLIYDIYYTFRYKYHKVFSTQLA